MHYVINMLALRFVGAAVEMSHGWFAAFLIFTLSAVGGTVLSAIFLPDAISVGASGGIFGTYDVNPQINIVTQECPQCKAHLHISYRRIHRGLFGRYYDELELAVQ